jgi:Holliday junction resolvase RusA-like endonuclease
VPPDSAGNAKAGGKAGRIEARYVYLVLRGQVRGGKNNMGVTKTGIHYPQKPWKLWRDAMLAQLQEQRIGPTICEPCAAEINYYAGDRKRRDLPAILDAIWHVLERGGVVKDDSLIKSVNLKGGYDKTHPRAVIRLTVMDASEQDQTP